jgi:hypothetical protein
MAHVKGAFEGRAFASTFTKAPTSPANGRTQPAKVGVHHPAHKQHYARPRPSPKDPPEMTPQALIPALLVPLIGYRVYRRLRTSFGRQPVQTKRMVARIVIFSVIAILFIALAFTQPMSLGAAVLGLAIGGIVAVIGLRLTKFELSPQGNFYTPHAYIGGAVSALLVARLVYRFFIVFPTMQTAAQHAAANGNPYAGFQSSPLTIAILMLTAGYYITYNAGILLKVRTSSSSTPPA